MGCTERLLLIRALLGLLAAGMVVAVIDLGACRLQRRGDCQQQTQAVAAASGAAIGWIGGVLTKHPE
jgi:hypothetical protein